jgi:DNA modification methylase
MELNKIYNIPCEEGFAKLKYHNIVVDCIVTSPPYNVDLGNNKYNKNPYDLYRDNKEHNEYIGWLKSIFDVAQCVLRDGATVAINIGDGKNGSVPTHSDIIQFMTRELDYVMVTTVIWKKNNVSNRTSWGSFMSPSCPSFPTPFEFILIFRYKDKYNKSINASKENITVSKDEFIKNSLAIWEFGAENLKKVGHPAAFSVELPTRVIQQMTYAGDVILDPFMGSGTTAIAAKKLNRNYIGFEISENYYNLAVDRLNDSSLVLF